MLRKNLFETTGAEFSRCLKYRYKLWRIWDSTKPCCLFILLNPSTADDIKNDPTVERCERRARMMGFGGLLVCNLFAYRATDPEVMKSAKDPVGPKNDKLILETATQSGMIICGWGEHGKFNSRSKVVLNQLLSNKIPLHILQLNRSGEPKHPLYVSYKRMPQPWKVNF